MAEAKPKPGRKTKCTPAVTAKILQHIKRGSFLETACAAAGVSSRQVREWMQRAAKGEQPYRKFADELEVAAAEAEGLFVAALLASAKKDWKAIAWWLEHGPAKKRYGLKAGLELSGKVKLDGDGPITKEAARKILEEKLGSRVLPRQLHDIDSELKPES